MTGSASVNAVVFVKGDEPRASSRDVAAAFNKNHRDVTRAIDNLIEKEPSLTPRNFAQGSFQMSRTGAQVHRSYDMSRDGFMLLVMGFTGVKALQLKLAWIGEFDRMEAELRARAANENEDSATLAGRGNDLAERQVLMIECRTVGRLYGRKAARAHLMASGRFEHIRAITEEIEAAEARLLARPGAVPKQEAGALWNWVDECATVNPMTATPVKELYDHYVRWCGRKGSRAMTVQAFRIGLTNAYGKVKYQRGYGLEIRQ